MQSLFSLIKKYWKLIIYQGIDKNYSESKRWQIINFNKISLLSFLLILPNVLQVYDLLPQSNTAITLFLLDSLFLGVILINRLKLHIVAKTYMFIISNLLIYWACNTYGLGFGIQYAYILLLYGIILYSENTFDLNAVIPATLPFIGFYLLYFTDFNPFTKIAVPIGFEKYFIIYNLFTFMVFSVLFSYIYARNNNRSYKKLTASRASLQERYNEVKLLNEALDHFAYSVSHDLRSPIASVLGLINLIKLEENIANIKIYSDMQEKSMNKLDAYIKKILEYSTITRAKDKIEEINFEDTANEIFEFHNLAISSRQIKKIIVCHAHSPFYGDKNKVGIILNNIIDNSIWFYDPIEENPFISIFISVTNEKSMIEIKDNGIGIEEKHLTKIFDMFYRGTERTKGSGLGLYIAKEAIDKMNGNVDVSSVPNAGTQIIIHLPNNNE